MVQNLEGVAFDPSTYYNALQYYTIDGKVRACSGGLKWFNLTEHKPTKTIKLRIRRKTKHMNPYTFSGVMVGVPAAGTVEQHHAIADTTAIDHVNVVANVRYQEWNQNFNFKRV